MITEKNRTYGSYKTYRSYSADERPRVGLWLPMFGCGGVERYHLDLARATADTINWRGCALVEGARTLTETVGELKTLMPLKSIYELAQECDVIINWGITDLNPLAAFARQGGKVVVIQHGDNTWARIWMHRAFRSAPDAMPISCVSVSKAAALLFEEMEMNSTILEAGVDLNRIAPSQSRDCSRDELHIADHEFAVGFVGRFSSEKNPLTAASIVGKLGVHYRAVYHGHAHGDEPAFREKAFSLSEGRVSFAARKWHTGDVYHALDALVVSSPQEAGPLVAIEAWLCGLPLVSTDVGVVREHHDCAEVIPDHNDIESFAESVRWLRTKAGTVNRDVYLHGIRRRMIERYSSVAGAKRWVDYLTRLVKRKI